jgi:hypothetical protein
MMIGERPNKKNIESLDLTRKVNLLRLCRVNVVFKVMRSECVCSVVSAKQFKYKKEALSPLNVIFSF